VLGNETRASNNVAQYQSLGSRLVGDGLAARPSQSTVPALLSFFDICDSVLLLGTAGLTGSAGLVCATASRPWAEDSRVDRYNREDGGFEKTRRQKNIGRETQERVDEGWRVVISEFGVSNERRRG
jgi:hypothetical protein